MHDDLFDFFYEALPGYEQVGLRRTLLGCWGSFQDPEYCNFAYKDMTDWGRKMFVTPGRRRRRQARHHRPGRRSTSASGSCSAARTTTTGPTRRCSSRSDPLGNPVDRRHPWNQHTNPQAAEARPRRQVQLGDVAALVRRPGPPRAGHRRRPARAAVVDRAGRPGRHRLRQGDRHSVQINLPKTALKGPVSFEWKIPQWSNTIERNRARTYFQAYAAACALHFVEKALVEIRAGRTKTWEKFEVPDEAHRLRLHRGGARRALAPHGHPGRQDRELPPVPADAVERQPARHLRHARPVRGRGAGPADLRGERPGELQGHRHHADGPQLRPVPAVRRAHVPRRRQDDREAALADDGRRPPSERGRERSRAPPASASSSCSTRSGRGGPVARERAEELVRTVVDLYGAGLERLLEIVDAGGALTDSTVDELAADELVAGLLVVHGLHPYGVAGAGRAGAGVRPAVPAARTAATWSCSGSTTTGVVRLRLLGHCDGCAGSTATLPPRSVEDAVEAAAPEVLRIDVAEPTAPAHPAPPCDADPGGDPVRAAASAGVTGPGPAPAADRGSASRGRAAAAVQSVLTRIRRAPVRPAGERCEMCGEPIAEDAHSHVVDVAGPGAAVHLPPVLAAVRLPGRGAALQGRAGPLPPAAADCRRRSGTTCRSRSAWRSSSATPRSTGSSRLPEPGRRHRVGAAAGRVGRGAGGRARHRPRWRRTSRRCWSGSTGSTVDTFLVPIDVCYELVGHLRLLLARLRRRPGRPPPAGRVLRRRSGAGAGDRARLHRPGRARRSRTPPRRRCCSGVRVTEPSGAAVHAIALRAQVHIEPQRRRYAGDRGGPADRPVRHGRPLVARRCGRSSGRTPTRDGAAASPARSSSTCRCPARTTSRSPAASTCTRWPTARCRWCCSSAARSSPAAATGFGVEQVPWHLEARVPAAGARSGATVMDTYFPGGGWIRLDRETLDALVALPVRARPDDLGAVRRRAAGRRLRGDPVTGPGRGRARVADAVLYEGYLLYPYRASSAKNQVRWQFGVLSPAGAAAAGLGEAPALSAELLLRPAAGARIDVHVRFLQVQQRVGRGAGPGRLGRRSTGCVAGDTDWIPWYEAVEREVVVGGLDAGRPARRPHGPGRGARRRGRRVAARRTGPPVGRLVRTRLPVTAELTRGGRAGSGRTCGWRSGCATPRPGTPAESDPRRSRPGASLVGAHLLLTGAGAGFVAARPTRRRTPRPAAAAIRNSRLVAGAGRRHRAGRADRSCPTSPRSRRRAPATCSTRPRSTRSSRCG